MAPIRGKCKRCDRPMRAHNERIADFPGTVRHKTRGLCDTCVKKISLPVKRTREDMTADEITVASAIARHVPQEEWKEVADMLGLTSPTIGSTQSHMSLPNAWGQAIS